MSDKNTKKRDSKAVKKLEEKRKKLTSEREKLLSKNEKAKEKEKEKNQRRLTAIESELTDIETKLSEFSEAEQPENTDAGPSNTPKPETPKVHVDKAAKKVLTPETSQHSNLKVHSKEQPKLPGLELADTEEVEATNQTGSKATDEDADSTKICQHCHKPIKLKKKPCETIMATKSCASIAPLKSTDRSPIRQPCSRSNSRAQSRTCIVCGGKIPDDVMQIPSDRLQPQLGPCRSSTSGRSQRSRNQEMRTRSKCSQLSQKPSGSLAGCQSYGHCSLCHKIIFENQSCASFDRCSKCKHSVDNFSHKAQYSPSKELKAVQSIRSVNFSLHDEKPMDSDDEHCGCQEKVLNSFNCLESMQTQSFCGCDSTMKCNPPAFECPDEPCDTGEDDICARLKKSLADLETYVPKEPSQLSGMRDMIEARIAASNAELEAKKDEPQKVAKEVDPNKPKRHRIRRLPCETDDFECPPNPCVISEEKKQRMLKLMEKQQTREKNRQADLKAQKEARLKALLAEKCGDDECKTDEGCGTNDDCTEYSKKYLKMKYEIELQNYLVEKLNRELQMKIDNKFPEDSINEMRCYLDKEVNKLRDMVEFTIFEQCRNKDLKWGSIPVSTLTSNKIGYSRSPCDVPKTPSGISGISAFSMLEDIKICQEKERCHQELEIQHNRHMIITAMIKDIQALECTLTQLKCEHDRLTESLMNLNMMDDEPNCPVSGNSKQLQQIKCRMNDIVTEIKSTKNDIDNVHAKLHLIRQ